MNKYSILLIILCYFLALWVISLIAGRKNKDNETFFTGNRQSPWWAVAIGMVGASISGVSFVSVPGMVGHIDFTYMQMVAGFFAGYLVIAKVLLPLYYKLNLTSIYTYLDERLGKSAYKTGASFFLLSKTIGAAARLYIVAIILQTIIFDSWNIPFPVTVITIVVLIWLYTHSTGIKTIVWTDLLQTIVMIVTLTLIIIQVGKFINISNIGWLDTLKSSEHTRVFVFDDWHSRQNFFKQFFSGIFVAVVMTGLDQDMMQKNLSCRNLRDAQKNMYWYGFAFIPVNLLFLVLGALLLVFAQQNGIALPEKGDSILPFIALNYLGSTALILFTLGMVAAAFSSADSALTALTTSFTVDILGLKNKDDKTATNIRRITHIGISLLFIVFILLIKYINNKSIIDTIYTIVSYTYGPLLGMYGFGLFTKKQTREKFIPYITVASPILCVLIDFASKSFWNYTMGYELLILNGFITFTGLSVFSYKKGNSNPLKIN